MELSEAIQLAVLALLDDIEAEADDAADDEALAAQLARQGEAVDALQAWQEALT